MVVVDCGGREREGDGGKRQGERGRGGEREADLLPAFTAVALLL